METRDSAANTTRTGLLPVSVLCQVFHPDTQSTSQLLSGVLSELAYRGYDVTVVSGYPGMHSGEPLLGKEIWRGITIYRGGLRASGKKSLLLRGLTYLSYSWHVVLHLMRSHGRCYVLVVTNPPFLPVIAWLVCRLRGHPFKVMLQDVYPDGLVAMGKVRQGGLVDRMWCAANRRTFRAASAIWVLGRDMSDRIQRKYYVPFEKVNYVPHWSPIDIPKPEVAEQTHLWSRLKLGNKFVVQYSGNMGLWHDTETIVLAAELLKSRTEIQFLFIGQGMRKRSAEELSLKLGVTNIIWMPYQDRDELSDSLSCCHVALISQRASLEGIAVPCKLYGILASGRAVIAQVPTGSEVALTVTEERCGRVVAPGDPAALAATIVELEAVREETNRMGERAHAAYRAKYTLTAGVAAFERGLAEWSPKDSLKGEKICAT